MNNLPIEDEYTEAADQSPDRKKLEMIPQMTIFSLASFARDDFTRL
jgi:hypothetical protein